MNHDMKTNIKDALDFEFMHNDVATIDELNSILRDIIDVTSKEQGLKVTDIENEVIRQIGALICGSRHVE